MKNVKAAILKRKRARKSAMTAMLSQKKPTQTIANECGMRIDGQLLIENPHSAQDPFGSINGEQQ